MVQALHYERFGQVLFEMKKVEMRQKKEGFE
jgi:hypothetical protein